MTRNFCKICCSNAFSSLLATLEEEEAAIAVRKVDMLRERIENEGKQAWSTSLLRLFSGNKWS